MQSARSSRLESHLTQCSTTPRTTKAYLEQLTQLVQQADKHRILYEEAKLAMNAGDTTAALVLFELLPMDYGQTREYVIKCRTYDQLCRNGLLVRKGSTELQEKLGGILHEDPLSTHIVRYSDVMSRNGFNVMNINSTTLFTMQEAMEISEMSEGHRQLFAVFAEANTPFLGRLWMNMLGSVQKCAPLVNCIKDGKKNMMEKKATAPPPLKRSEKSRGTKKKLLDDDDDDDTAPSDMDNVKWKAGEAFLISKVVQDDEDDEDDTAGDDENE